MKFKRQRQSADPGWCVDESWCIVALGNSLSSRISRGKIYLEVMR